MAKNEELEIDEAVKKGSSKNKLLIIIAAVLLILSMGAAGVFFMVGDDDVENTEIVDAKPQFIRSIYYQFENPFVVTVLSEDKQRYLQISAVIKTKQQEAIDVIKKHDPVIKSKLNELFSSQQLTSLQTAQGREDLNQQATAQIQEFLVGKAENLAIEQVLFIDFVMQ